MIEDVIKTSNNEKLTPEMQEKRKLNIIPGKCFNETIEPLKLLNQNKINSLPEVRVLLINNSPHLQRKMEQNDSNSIGHLIQNIYLNI